MLYESVSARNLNKDELELYNHDPERGTMSLCLAMKAMFEEEARYITAGEDSNNANAFLHTYWAALLAKNISPTWAQEWTDAHEFEKSKDSSSVDLFNNRLGIDITSANINVSDERLALIVERQIDAGEGRQLVKGSQTKTTTFGKREITIFSAIYAGVLSLVMKFIEAGFCNQRNSDTMTPLMFAAQYNKQSIVEYLTSFSNINNVDKEKKTALMYALRSDISILTTLLKNGADFNMVCIEGESALMKACVDSTKQVIEALVNAGAEINQKSKRGLTAIDIAKNEGRDDIVKYLEKVKAGN